jgi:hypothetical protein
MVVTAPGAILDYPGAAQSAGRPVVGWAGKPLRRPMMRA